MPAISIQIQNKTGQDNLFQVWDLFGGGQTQIMNIKPGYADKCPLTIDEISPAFVVQADNSGVGAITYQARTGPLTNINPVSDGQVYPAD
jgi:hypothetical protein